MAARSALRDSASEIAVERTAVTRAASRTMPSVALRFIAPGETARMPNSHRRLTIAASIPASAAASGADGAGG